MAVVPRFYEKVTSDPMVGPLFAGLDIDAQATKQLAFLSRAMGGPAQYHGRDLRAAHGRLVDHEGLSDAHFDRVLALLDEALVELELSAPLRAEVAALLQSTRREVLGR